MGTSKPSLSKRKLMVIQSSPAIKHLVFQRLRNQSRPYIGSEAHSRLVKATGDRDWIPNFKELKMLMSNAGQSSGPSSSAAKTSKPS